VVVFAREVVVVTKPPAVVVVTDPAVVVVDTPTAVVVVVVDLCGAVVVVADLCGAVVVVVDLCGAVVVVAAKVVVVVAKVVVVVAAAHVGLVMVLSSSVTAPLRARTRPSTVAPVSSVAEVKARMLPTKVLVVPKVAELPTCQNTLQAWAPSISLTVLLEAVVSVDTAWKMNTELRLFCPSKVTVPGRPMEEDAWYTPGASVCPPRSLLTTLGGVRPAASL
jgi:hypothetical protein